MPATYTCDICGKKPAGIDDNGLVLCELHRAKDDLFYLEKEYQDEKTWLENTFLKDQRDRLEKIEVLKLKIKQLEK